MKVKAILLFMFLAGTTVLFSLKMSRTGLKESVEEPSCVVQQDLLANDSEMHDVLVQGTVYVFLNGYQKCNSLRRGDILVIENPSLRNEYQELIPRILRASPGDTIEVFPAPQSKGYNLKINGEMLFDVHGKKPHLFGEGSWDLKGSSIHPIFRKGKFILQEDEYFLFSAQSPSKNDSSVWGSISGSRIKGRAIIKK